MLQMNIILGFGKIIAKYNLKTTKKSKPSKKKSSAKEDIKQNRPETYYIKFKPPAEYIFNRNKSGHALE